MSRSIVATLALASVDASTLTGVVDHYVITSTEAGGAQIATTVSLDSTAATFSLDPGTWVSTMTAVAADGTSVGAPVVTLEPNPLVVTDVVVVMVNIPASGVLSVA